MVSRASVPSTTEVKVSQKFLKLSYFPSNLTRKARCLLSSRGRYPRLGSSRSRPLSCDWIDLTTSDRADESEPKHRFLRRWSNKWRDCNQSSSSSSLPLRTERDRSLYGFR